MYRQILIPTEKDHVVSLPPELYGKQVEIIAFEVHAGTRVKGNDKKKFLDDIESIPDFPSIEQIRDAAWPEKW